MTGDFLAEHAGKITIGIVLSVVAIFIFIFYLAGRFNSNVDHFSRPNMDETTGSLCQDGIFYNPGWMLQGP